MDERGAAQPSSGKGLCHQLQCGQARALSSPVQEIRYSSIYVAVLALSESYRQTAGPEHQPQL